MTARAPKYIAKLQGVRELALLGAADLAWWTNHLAPEGLEPVGVDGSAQILVTGLDARWAGIAFNDLSFSVVARQGDQEGLYFARAFNTSRFLVFFEKHWFRLPYDRRPVHARDGALKLGDGDIDGAMAAREPAAAEPVDQVVRVFLPGRKWLQVRVLGDTSTHAFDEARDRFEVSAACADPVVAGLHASGFRGVTWHVRPDATHARTKTFQR